MTTKFIWECPNCKTVNDNQNWADKEAISTCKQCGKSTIDLSEALCIHGYAVDMACNECPRSGFRFTEDTTDRLRGGLIRAEDRFHLPLSDEPYYPPDMIEDQLADEGSLDGPGYHCERMQGKKTVTEESWRTLHHEHPPFPGIFGKTYNENQPSAYRLYKLICTCGASLQCMEELEGVD